MKAFRISSEIPLDTSFQRPRTTQGRKLRPERLLPSERPYAAVRGYRAIEGSLGADEFLHLHLIPDGDHEHTADEGELLTAPIYIPHPKPQWLAKRISSR